MTQPLIISGAPEGYDAQLLLREYEKNGSVIHVARDDKRLEAMLEALAFFAPDGPHNHQALQQWGFG